MTESGKVRDAPKFLRVVRMDSVPLQKAYFTEEGYLRDKPILTSVGIFEYLNPDGTIRRELRPPEEVFAPGSLASFKGKPVCFTHDNGLLDKDNVSEAQVGTILSEGERDGNDVRAEIIIYDTDELKRCRMRELSLGYSLDIDETPGIWNGERYDAVQRNIFVNHLAVVRDARAGEQARLNFDSRDNTTKLAGGKGMSKKNVDTSRLDAQLSDDELALALEKLHDRLVSKTSADSAEEELPAVEPEATEEPKEDDINEKLAALDARRARRDEQGDPKDVDSAMGFIAEMDEDIDLYKNIIDTLQAKLDFSKPTSEAEAEDSVDEMEKLKKDADDVIEEEKPMEEPAPVEDEDKTEDDELMTDADDLEDEEPIEEKEEEDDDLVMDACDDKLTDNKRMDAAAIDRLVSQKIMLGELGDAVGVKGLARRNVLDAKKEIIKAVRPEMRLDGKSSEYINAAFEYARAEIRANRKKGTAAQKQQMFNMDSANEPNTGADAARRRMIERQNKRD